MEKIPVTKRFRLTNIINRQKVRLFQSYFHLNYVCNKIFIICTYVIGKSTVPRQETNSVNMRQSISELDSLLDDLNHAQRVGFSNSGVNRHEITTNESGM